MVIGTATVVYDPADDDVVLVSDTFLPGFGLSRPGVYGVGITVRWPRHDTLVTLLGQTEHRDAVRDELAASFRRIFRGSEVLELGDGVRIEAELARGFDRSARAIGSSPARLVVAEFDGGSREDFDNACLAVANRGRALGWMLLLVGSTLPKNPLLPEIPGPTVLALGPMDCTPESGAVIAGAVRLGVRTATGIGAVLDGAPVDWAQSFEDASTSA